MAPQGELATAFSSLSPSHASPAPPSWKRGVSGNNLHEKLFGRRVAGRGRQAPRPATRRPNSFSW
eukprot:15436207-Alexandrium_andersonii.AAC.1